MRRGHGTLPGFPFPRTAGRRLASARNGLLRGGRSDNIPSMNGSQESPDLDVSPVFNFCVPADHGIVHGAAQEPWGLSFDEGAGPAVRLAIPDACRDLLRHAGFRDVNMTTEQLGYL